MISEQWQKAAAKSIGLRGDIDFHTAKVGMTLHIPCEAGDHVVDVKVQKGMPPEAVAKHMVQKGWTIGSRLRCPDCKKSGQKKEESVSNPTPVDALIVSQILDMKRTGGLTNAEIGARFGRNAKFVANVFANYKNKIPPNDVVHVDSKRAAKALKKIITALEPTARVNIVPTLKPFTEKDLKPMATPAPATQGSSVIAVAASQEETRRRLKRHVIQWLDESYDEEKCCYKSGFSDGTIAKETGAAEKFVGDIREDIYGPMGEPDDLRLLREAFATHIEAGKAWMTEHDRISQTFHARLDRLIAKNGWKADV